MAREATLMKNSLLSLAAIPEIAVTISSCLQIRKFLVGETVSILSQSNFHILFCKLTLLIHHGIQLTFKAASSFGTTAILLLLFNPKISPIHQSTSF